MIITRLTHPKYNAKFETGAFLVAIGEQNSGIYLVHEENLKKEIELFLKMLPNAQKYQFKVVGKQNFVQLIERELAIHRINIEKAVLIMKAWEIIFDTIHGKLLISRLESVDASSKSIDQKMITETKIKVLIVDDSSTVRKILRKVLSEDPAIEVVAEAERPSQVEGLIIKYKPHLITLDIQMPEMNGVELLKIIFPKYKIPTIMISSISMEEGNMVLQALEEGAVDYIQKPTFDELSHVIPIIIEKVKSAAQAKLVAKSKYSPIVAPRLVGPEVKSDQILAIGASTGGTEALREILVRLPKNIPPTLIVQHIPPVFSKAFADRLNSLCAFEVKEAQDGDELKPSRVLIAPGGKQMKLVRNGNSYHVQINDDAPMNRHRPSVDYMFNSIVEVCKLDMVGVILTGMGADGANGLLKMKQQGAWTMAQSEESCIVFGMPKEAIKRGAAAEVVHLNDIPEKLLLALSKKKAA